MSQIDPAQESLRHWSVVAPAWEAHRDCLFENTRSVSEWLVDQVDPQAGQTVLELTAGPGETGFLAAPRLGPGGRLAPSSAAPEATSTSAGTRSNRWPPRPAPRAGSTRSCPRLTIRTSSTLTAPRRSCTNLPLSRLRIRPPRQSLPPRGRDTVITVPTPGFHALRSQNAELMAARKRRPPTTPRLLTHAPSFPWAVVCGK
jgi:hypothetical protein